MRYWMIPLGALCFFGSLSAKVAYVTTHHAHGRQWLGTRPSRVQTVLYQNKPRVVTTHRNYSHLQRTYPRATLVTGISRPQVIYTQTEPLHYVAPADFVMPRVDIEPAEDSSCGCNTPVQKPVVQPRQKVPTALPYRWVIEQPTLARQDLYAEVLQMQTSGRGRLVTLSNGMVFGIPSLGSNLTGKTVYIYPPKGHYYRGSHPRIDTGYQLKIGNITYRAQRFE